MSLISSIVAFAKADAEGKGIPVLITAIQALAAAKNGAQRAAAILQFETNGFAAGLQIGQDILQDAATTAVTELQSDLPKTS